MKLSLFKNFILVILGTIGAQALTMAFSPFITRIYGPEVFGVFGSFNAIIAVLIPIAALSYPMSIILPKDDKDSFALIVLSSMLSILFLLVSSSVMFIYEQEILEFLNVHNMDFIYVVLPLTILTSVNIETINYTLIRKGLYKFTAKIVFLQSLIINSMKLIIGFYIPTVESLISVTIFGMFISLCILMLGIRASIKQHIKDVTFKKMLNVAKKYSEFPKYRAPQGIIANINQSLPVIMLSVLFGPISAGYYTLCRTVLLFPVNLISKAINDVLFPDISYSYKSNDEIGGKLIKTTLLLCIIGFVPVLIMLLFGRELFCSIFGDNWGVSGDYSKWISIWLFFTLINRPCVAAIPVLRLEKFLLVNSIFNMVLCVVGFYVGEKLFQTDIGALAGYCILSIIPQLTIILAVFLKVSKYDRYIKIKKTNTSVTP